MSEMWDAVVLGGGDAGDEFAASQGVAVKPLLALGGRPMAAWVLDALRASGRVRRVAYVGPTTPELDARIDVRVTDQGSLLGNLEAGVAALAGEAGRRVMVVTADIPMLTGAELAEVLDAAPNAGLVYPVVTRAACEAAYPGVKRTYARLRDGVFTGGNVFLLDPSLIGRFLPRLRALLAARKNPARLALMIGPGVLVRLLLGRLRIAALEARVGALLGVEARALVTARASVGTDVDKLEDLALARRALGLPDA
ncbi:NTP transferase domain-containing protein [Deinococcus maricopensis]|uniref:MobA-like NTP transferase domain-containing protein n=1 Tax=Deinococcus maricopensis (strain DSM 21211 / LMG 22137 / NRRL B-23946 / LB-34) TaxID=709986 RepID=E8U4L2_DEIML|nr:NTP transferase domain-containing protein [Deinococcus maricopensis]ADV68877.1 hypothetical protein Deima_3250 [Deinococcus maricopensis DSM 21211]